MADEALASPWRAWRSLVWVSWQRQARARRMVWVALGLLLVTTLLIAMITPRAWDMRFWRSSRKGPTHGQQLQDLALVQAALLLRPMPGGVQRAVVGELRGVLLSPELRLRVGF